MTKKLRIAAVVGAFAIAIGVVATAVGTTSAVPQYQRYYEVAPGGQCSECAPVVRTSCRLTGCLPTIPPGGDLCQYDCFGG